eukprot:TRINITY_DN48908_c0_g1_i1.p1 TRINITY_DN48908_c0_g1~~TRINITY_DN48908_c0_g1_i1.p1  ORF type:complete len:190 (-),score=17.07 TRINITY_DN48908_c0_g1_i1:614-1183(-)
MHAVAIFSISLIFYHLSEFLLVYIYTPEELSLSSALISIPYLIAMALGILEYKLSLYLFPDVKMYLLRTLQSPAIVLLIVGESLRKAAWLTAKPSFTHLIKERRRPSHKLVTHGVYAFCRHPGYLGWFLWAVGTQILLANAVCSPVFAYVAWKFFRERIPIEEFYLRRMFGSSYDQYRSKTPTFFPGVP